MHIGCLAHTQLLCATNSPRKMRSSTGTMDKPWIVSVSALVDGHTKLRSFPIIQVDSHCRSRQCAALSLAPKIFGPDVRTDPAVRAGSTCFLSAHSTRFLGG